MLRIKTLYNFKAFRQASKQKLWISIISVLILAVIYYCCSYFIYTYKVSSMFNNSVKAQFSKFPEFKIENGELIMPGRNVQVSRVFGIPVFFDPADTLDIEGKSFNIANIKTSGIVLGKNEAKIAVAQLKLDSVKYGSILKGSLTNTDLSSKDYKWVSIGPIWIFRKLAVSFFFIWLLFFKIWSVLFFSYLAVYYDHEYNTGFTYKQKLGITCYAITYIWILELLIKLTSFGIGYKWLLNQLAFWVVGAILMNNIFKKVKKVIEDEYEIRNTEIEGTTFTVD